MKAVIGADLWQLDENTLRGVLPTGRAEILVTGEDGIRSRVSFDRERLVLWFLRRSGLWQVRPDGVVRLRRGLWYRAGLSPIPGQHPQVRDREADAMRADGLTPEHYDGAHSEVWLTVDQVAWALAHYHDSSTGVRERRKLAVAGAWAEEVVRSPPGN